MQTKDPPKRSRSPGYSTEIADTISNRLINGESLRAICADPVMPARATVFRWLASNQEFRRPRTAGERQSAAPGPTLAPPCRRAALRGRKRCRLHGGLSPGAPRGPKNGNFKTGDWTTEAIEERKWLRSLVQSFAKRGTSE